MSEWQPIEKADKCKRQILTDGEFVFEGRYILGDWVRADNENLAFATHFMPLPPPPERIER